MGDSDIFPRSAGSLSIAERGVTPQKRSEDPRSGSPASRDPSAKRRGLRDTLRGSLNRVSLELSGAEENLFAECGLAASEVLRLAGYFFLSHHVSDDAGINSDKSRFTEFLRQSLLLTYRSPLRGPFSSHRDPLRGSSLKFKFHRPFGFVEGLVKGEDSLRGSLQEMNPRSALLRNYNVRNYFTERSDSDRVRSTPRIPVPRSAGSLSQAERGLPHKAGHFKLNILRSNNNKPLLAESSLRRSSAIKRGLWDLNFNLAGLNWAEDKISGLLHNNSDSLFTTKLNNLIKTYSFFMFGNNLSRFDKNQKMKLININHYKGRRLKNGYPSRGQRTKSNAKNSKILRSIHLKGLSR